jgi:tRNA-2-methylthio-N6-dimethylallyladenosine synthase
MKLIEEINFDMSFSFIYSPRPGTPAADLPDDVDMEVKKARLTGCNRINTSPCRSAAPCWARCSASWWRALQDGSHAAQWPHREQPGGQLRGPHRLIGGFADVEITEVRPNSLRGKFIRGENEMNLRIATAPSEILPAARTTYRTRWALPSTPLICSPHPAPAGDRVKTRTL